MNKPPNRIGGPCGRRRSPDDLGRLSEITQARRDEPIIGTQKAYGNVDFESRTVNQVIITSLCHGGFDDVADSFIQGSQEPDPNPLRSAFKRLQKKIVKSKTKHLNLLKITFCRSKELTKTSYDLLGWMALRIEPESSYGSHLLSQVKQEELVKEMTNQFLLARVTSLNNQQEWETMKKLPVATDLGSEF
ncbi:hypothetical protein Tco_1265693 [Tanacetum coccineum]